ncbi:MAG: anthranilate synthase component I family protein [Chloroflexota bacterium]
MPYREDDQARPMPPTATSPAPQAATAEVVSFELNADTLTPVGAALRLGERLAFLLESVEGGVRYGRHSLVGVRGQVLSVRGSHAVLRDAEGAELRRFEAPDPLEALRAVLPPAARDGRLPIPLAAGVGYLAYEVAARWERLPVPEADPVGLPEAVFHIPAAMIVFDHLEQVARLATLGEPGDGTEATGRLNAVAALLEQPSDHERPRRVQRAAPALSLDDAAARERFETGVAKLVEEIRAGEMLQAVLGRRFTLRGRYDPFAVYRALRRINPSPYLFYVDLAGEGGGSALVGASPELLVRVRDGEVVTRPIAGTRPRHDDPLQDAALEEELKHDEKELAEHAMLVDLARNDVGRVAEPASVTVPTLRAVERYSHVMHLVSEVRGRLAPQHDAFDALRAAFPAGTVSGAPKVRAMQAIAGLEGERRGPYGGAIGFFAPDDLEAAIIIRSAVIGPAAAHVHAGAGIVADSQPAREADEVDAKAEAMRAALGGTR